MTNTRAAEVIGYLYQEGEIDIILFGYILGLVSSDLNDVSLQKRPLNRLRDAIELVRFLQECGDFTIGQSYRDEDGRLVFEEGIDAQKFAELVTERYRKGGIEDIDLITQTWIKKVNLGADVTTQIPEKIANIW